MKRYKDTNNTFIWAFWFILFFLRKKKNLLLQISWVLNCHHYSLSKNVYQFHPSWITLGKFCDDPVQINLDSIVYMHQCQTIYGTSLIVVLRYVSSRRRALKLRSHSQLVTPVVHNSFANTCRLGKNAWSIALMVCPAVFGGSTTPSPVHLFTQMWISASMFCGLGKSSRCRLAKRWMAASVSLSILPLDDSGNNIHGICILPLCWAESVIKGSNKLIKNRNCDVPLVILLNSSCRRIGSVPLTIYSPWSCWLNIDRISHSNHCPYIRV